MEGDNWTCQSLPANQHFNPLPPHGGRLQLLCNVHCFNIFQSTPSAWRETKDIYDSTNAPVISIHSLRMEGDWTSPTSPWDNSISIHSLRMEGDVILSDTLAIIKHFNPLPPHGGRLKINDISKQDIPFQSTPSAWRETSQQMIESELELHFNPLPPHGGRLVVFLTPFPAKKFQSTPSAWRETITIWKYLAQYVHFNPLPPHGGRRVSVSRGTKYLHFNPLPPHGGRHFHILR